MGRVNAATKAAQARKELALKLFAEGLTYNGVSETMGISRGTLERWHRTDPEYRRRKGEITAALNAAKDPESFADDGTFETFRKAMFGMDTYWHQREIIRAIEKAPRMEITLVNLPPEHGKTTVLEDYVCYRAARDPNVRITYVSEGQPHARKVVRHVKSRMTRVDLYPHFISRYGPFHVEGQEDSDRAWTNDYIEVHKANHDERDYTLEARGIKSAVAGTRADILLVDDIQSLRSLNQTQIFLDTLRQDFITRVGKNGKIVVVGTRVGDGDIYEALLASGLVAEYVELPAVDADGNALCPEMWDAESLAIRRKQVGEKIWSRTYQQRPISDLEASFPAEIVARAKRRSLHLGGVGRDGEDLTHGKTRILALDPALTGQNVLVAAAYDRETFVLLDLWAQEELARTERILTNIAEAAQRYRPSLLVVETNAMQRGIARDQRLLDMGRNMGFRVVEHETGRNKTDPSIGVPQMPSDFMTGSIWIPDGDEAARVKFEPLVEQLLRWRPDIPTRLLKQDCVMALWFAWMQWNRIRKVGHEAGGKWRRPGFNDMFAHQRRAA